MPSTEKKQKSELVSVIDSFLDEKQAGKDENKVEFLSIIDFIERFKLLPDGLFPVQKFILKLYYNIPLDDKEKTIKITDRFNVKVLYEFTEVEYLEFLHDQGRCNIKAQDSHVRHELILVLGRRSGKSTLSAIISAYELYKLLRRVCPQAFYGIPVNSEIRVLCIANDKEQASIVYGDMAGYVDNVDYFKSSMTNQTQTFMRFQTDQDRKKYGKNGRSTIAATFKSSIAKGLRGRGIICYVLDEIAFFVDDGKCVKLSSLVRTSDGLRTFDEILDTNNVDRSKTGWTSIRPIEVLQELGHTAVATRVYYGGRQMVRSVVTKSRYNIDPTPQHRLKVMSASGNIEWKYVRDIQVGDYVGINRSARIWPGRYVCCSEVHRAKNVRCTQVARIPEFLDDKLGEFLGVLVGDGTWCSGEDDNLVQVTGGCEQFLPFVQEHFARYFDTFRIHHKPPHEHNTCEVSPWSVTKCSQPFRTFLDSLGYRFDVTKSTKSVPWVIFQSPKSVVAAFLRGLFETDGGCEQGGRTVTLASASEQLMREVQLLLLDFGITASRYSKWNRKYQRTYHYVRLIGYESRKIFAREIGFITPRKQAELAMGVQSGRDASNIIPNQTERLRRILLSVPKATTLSRGNDARTRMIRLCSSSANPKRRSSISYGLARRFVDLGRKLGADMKALAELDHICRTNYYWDKVVSVSDNEADVADLLVPDGHEYVAQGMTNHNSSAEQIYRAINPSIAQFSPKDPKNKHKAVGPSDGRAIMISSPDARDGFFYRHYQLSLSGGPASKNILMIQAPTWEVNPTLDKSYYEVEFSKDPKSFTTEHGAEFSDRVRGWIEDSNDLLECVNPELKPIIRGGPRELFWAGVDFGIVRDGTAIALVHFVNGKIELAYHEVWYAGKNWNESNPHLTVPLTEYARTLKSVSRLDMSEISEWFRVLSTRFYIEKGIFDQWAGPIFEQELHKRGLKQFEMKNFSVSDSSHAYHMAKMCMFGRQLSIYNYPISTHIVTDSTMLKHSPLVSELLELQATSGGKNITIVEAPKVAGKHDDMSDAFVRGVMLAVEYVKSHPGVLETSMRHIVSPVQQAPMPGSYHRYHSMRKRMHGVPDRLRDPSRR
jgi:intein/homing endonuclease